MPPVLGLHDLTVVRDGKPILDDVSWEVEPDQRWVVLGPNGAGKTTLLQIVSANVHPSSGSATILGETLGRPDILSFDMGGTTAKVGLIQDGRPSVTKDYNVGGHAGAGIGGMSLSRACPRRRAPAGRARWGRSTGSRRRTSRRRRLRRGRTEWRESVRPA